jgi:hypothetical protein
MRRTVGRVPPRPAKHTVEQRRLVHRGREFHFVSYDGQPANASRGLSATAPAWWLMGPGTRWEVAPYRPEQAPEELDRLFTRWIETHVIRAERQRRGRGTPSSRRRL